VNGQPINDQTWAGIRAEFTLPTLPQVRRRLSELMEDPEPVMRQLVRVFIDEGTLCPGFQFQPDLSLNPVVVGLFQHAMKLRTPHNYFALWIMTPCPALPWWGHVRPTGEKKQLARLLDLSGRGGRGRRSRRRRQGRCSAGRDRRIRGGDDFGSRRVAALQAVSPARHATAAAARTFFKMRLLFFAA
jgi:hypothetical protein